MSCHGCRQKHQLTVDKTSHQQKTETKNSSLLFKLMDCGWRDLKWYQVFRVEAYCTTNCFQVSSIPSLIIIPCIMFLKLYYISKHGLLLTAQICHAWVDFGSSSRQNTILSIWLNNSDIESSFGITLYNCVDSLHVLSTCLCAFPPGASALLWTGVASRVFLCAFYPLRSWCGLSFIINYECE